MSHLTVPHPTPYSFRLGTGAWWRESERRNLWLFDTFEGMPPPTGADVDLIGKKADYLMSTQDREANSIWASCALDDVKRNVESTGYPKELIRYVKGRVENTIPELAPERIALLRLDTDWYDSTYHELVHLYPRLSLGGVLIIDDYGYWRGSRKAALQSRASTRFCTASTTRQGCWLNIHNPVAGRHTLSISG
jgi:Macrocin-O-methyltransferase (TylF)